jgi:hypothetical protein
MSPKIKKKIPIPKERNSYTILDSLNPGESVTFPLGEYLCVNHAYCYRQTRDGKKFRRKKEGTKLRVWRRK